MTASDDPALKLTLARLLPRRYGPEFGPGLTPSSAAMAGADEAVDIVDQLLETPQRKPALASALNEANASPESRLRWANAAMEKVDTDNPALLPAKKRGQRDWWYLGAPPRGDGGALDQTGQ